ncbi:MAG: hypothetical protein JSS79_05145 [Bacteroidetes bacterium]|nr:hypothetical protein [Bacteroidota bacterium]
MKMTKEELNVKNEEAGVKIRTIKVSQSAYEALTLMKAELTKAKGRHITFSEVIEAMPANAFRTI